MIVAFCGQAGSGKDTSSDYLVKTRGYVKVALADPLKRICREVFDFSDEQLWGPSEKRNEPDKRYKRAHQGTSKACSCCGADLDLDADKPCYLTPRYALQRLGTEWGRDCYGDVWVRYALRVAYDLIHPQGRMPAYDVRNGLRHVVVASPEGSAYQYPTGVTISDVRFMNEVLAIRNAHGVIFRLRRRSAGLSGEAAQHQSEQEQAAISDSLFDAIIYNDGSIEELHAKIDAELQRLYPQDPG